MKETIRVLLSEEEVDRRIKEVADQINRDYAGKEVHLICVLKGGVFFMCELAKRITVPVSLDFMSVSSYGDDTKSSGVVRIVKELLAAGVGEKLRVEAEPLAVDILGHVSVFFEFSPSHDQIPLVFFIIINPANRINININCNHIIIN